MGYYISDKGSILGALLARDTGYGMERDVAPPPERGQVIVLRMDRPARPFSRGVGARLVLALGLVLALRLVLALLLRCL